MWGSCHWQHARSARDELAASPDNSSCCPSTLAWDQAMPAHSHGGSNLVQLPCAAHLQGLEASCWHQPPQVALKGRQPLLLCACRRWWLLWQCHAGLPHGPAALPGQAQGGGPHQHPQAGRQGGPTLLWANSARPLNVRFINKLSDPDARGCQKDSKGQSTLFRRMQGQCQAA